jgi:hypothetical protein
MIAAALLDFLVMEKNPMKVSKNRVIATKKQSHRQFCGPISDWLACGIVLAGDLRAWSVLDSNGGAIYLYFSIVLSVRQLCSAIALLDSQYGFFNLKFYKIIFFLIFDIIIFK